MTDKESRQYGPWPGELESLVAQVRYRNGWTFWLTDEERDPADTHGHAAGGLTLIIITLTPNSYDARQCGTCGTTVANYRVRHLFPVPTTTLDRRVADWQPVTRCPFRWWCTGECFTCERRAGHRGRHRTRAVSDELAKRRAS